jgi:tetratricopeptide (TPR) repeat protein
MASKCAAESATADDDSLMQARKYMERAVAIQPDRVNLHRKLAELASAAGDLEEAAKALRTCHELAPDNVQIIVDLANIYVRMGHEHFVDALKVLDKDDSDIHDPLAIYLWTFLGNDQNARRVYDRCLKTSSRFLGDWHYGQLVRAHCQLFQGHADSARGLADECLESKDEPPDESAVANWAEFFLCAEDFEKVKTLLGADRKERHALCALADYFGGDPEVNEDSVLAAWQHGSWGFTELIFFRERVKRSGQQSYGRRLDIIEKLIRKTAYSSYFARNEGSVFWRRPSHGSHQIVIRGIRSVRIGHANVRLD